MTISEFYSSALFGKIDGAAYESDYPLQGTLTPVNWALVDIDDGTFYIAEYIGILDKAGRTAAQTEQVKAFAEWFGSAEVQAAWADEFDSFPCNAEAVGLIWENNIPAMYQIPNFALNLVPGTDMTYAAYVAAHSNEWTSIMTNLGFYWADASTASREPDWDSLDWDALIKNAA